MALFKSSANPIKITYLISINKTQMLTISNPNAEINRIAKYVSKIFGDSNKERDAQDGRLSFYPITVNIGIVVLFS